MRGNDFPTRVLGKPWPGHKKSAGQGTPVRQTLSQGVGNISIGKPGLTNSGNVLQQFAAMFVTIIGKDGCALFSDDSLQMNRTPPDGV